MITHLSPTAFRLFEESPKDFYLKYILKGPKLPQTKPMAIGSAFDAYVKSYLYAGLVGQNPKYTLEALFESQVEPQNRTVAFQDGKKIFDEYARLGALANLMLELSTSVGKPLFEFEIKGLIEGPIGDVPMVGKPDVFFINDRGARVVLDWKVNGYYSANHTSPMPGYIKILPGGGMHKDCMPMKVNGIEINVGSWFEDRNSDWAAQLAIYSWLLGEKIGSQNCIFAVEQIVGNPIRVASHRMRISREYQLELIERLSKCWKTINEDFDNDFLRVL